MSKANLHELMLLYLADALTEEEHAVVKSRLKAGDPEAKNALREARELYASLPLALDPVELDANAADNLMRQVEADALRDQQAIAQAKRAKPGPRLHGQPEPPSVMDTAAPAQDTPERQPGWILPAALAASCAIVASAAVFFLARWDAQQELARVAQRADTLQLEIDSQKKALDQQNQLVKGLSDQVARQSETLGNQSAQLDAQDELLTAQAQRLLEQIDRVAGVERSLATTQAMTDELRSLFVGQRSDLMVLMQREDEIDRVLSLLSAPRLEAYVLAGTDEEPDAAGRLFYDPVTRRLRMTVANLAPAQAGQTYQAWFVLDDGAGGPVSLGTFNTNAAGEAVFEATLNNAPDRIALAAVSVEPLGGVPAPTGAIVIAGGTE
ncbi:MAG: anti-sigma factor domain-containing protein [Phycisphaerales bacterium JB063]